MHCVGNYFSKKETSNVDIELDAGTSDEEYLSTLRQQLAVCYNTHRPQLTFFQAGVDPHEADALGKLTLTHSGLRKRNRLVCEAAVAHGSGLVVTMGGGYPKDLSVLSQPFGDVVTAHVNVYQDCASVHQQAFGML